MLRQCDEAGKAQVQGGSLLLFTEPYPPPPLLLLLLSGQHKNHQDAALSLAVFDSAACQCLKTNEHELFTRGKSSGATGGMVRQQVKACEANGRGAHCCCFHIHCYCYCLQVAKTQIHQMAGLARLSSAACKWHMHCRHHTSALLHEFTASEASRWKGGTLEQCLKAGKAQALWNLLLLFELPP